MKAKKKIPQIRYVHGIEQTKTTITIARRRRRYSIQEWIDEAPGRRERLPQHDRRYKALWPIMRDAYWLNDEIQLEA